MAEPSPTLRLFFAVHLDATAELRRVHRALTELGPAVRPVDLAQLHVTLRFLGPTPAHHVQPLGEALRRAAGTITPEAIRWGGLGRFPRVVYAWPVDPPWLRTLAAGLERELATLGFGPADRPFAAHLTLARLKPARRRGRGRDAVASPAVEELVTRHAQTPLGASAVRAVSLLASRLEPTGPVYEVLERAWPPRDAGR